MEKLRYMQSTTACQSIIKRSESKLSPNLLLKPNVIKTRVETQKQVDLTTVTSIHYDVEKMRKIFKMPKKKELDKPYQKAHLVMNYLSA